MDVDGDGDVALAWTADSGDGRSQQFATYDATSTPLGDGNAAGDGGFVVQWLDHLSNPPEGYQAFVVQARHWGSDGAPGAALEMVNRTAGPSQALTAPSLAADDDGALVSAWGFESAGDPPEARATAFDANGDLVGERATLVETLPEDETFFGNEGTPKVALSKDLAAMAWYNDGGDTLQARVAPRQDLTPPDGGSNPEGDFHVTARVFMHAAGPGGGRRRSIHARRRRFLARRRRAHGGAVRPDRGHQH